LAAQTAEHESRIVWQTKLSTLADWLKAVQN